MADEIEHKHTPGPWHRNIKPARKYCIVFAGRNNHVAAVQSSQAMSDDEVEANCNLITAAPDLLEALVKIEAALRKDSRDKSILSDTAEYHLDGQAMYAAINAARVAIAKASAA